MKEFYDYLSALESDTAEAGGESAAQCEKTVLRQMGGSRIRRVMRKNRLTAAIIAAAVAVCGTVAAVSGALRYNRQLADSQFGTLGTARLESLIDFAPVTFTNGRVNATVEGLLCDGSSAVLLTTFAPADPKEEIDWTNELEISCEKGVINSDGDPAFRNAWVNTHHTVFRNNEAWVSWDIKILPDRDPSAEEVTFVFSRWTDKSPQTKSSNPDLYANPEKRGGTHNALTDGLEITFPIRQNVPVVTLKAETGETVRMSGYELFRDGRFPFANSLSDITLLRRDGSTARATAPSAHEVSGTGMTMGGGTYQWANARIYETFDGVAFHLRKPDTFCGFIDVRQISGIEIGGVRYSCTE